MNRTPNHLAAVRRRLRAVFATLAWGLLTVALLLALAGGLFWFLTSVIPALYYHAFTSLIAR